MVPPPNNPNREKFSQKEFSTWADISRSTIHATFQSAFGRHYHPASRVRRVRREGSRRRRFWQKIGRQKIGPKGARTPDLGLIRPTL